MKKREKLAIALCSLSLACAPDRSSEVPEAAPEAAALAEPRVPPSGRAAELLSGTGARLQAISVVSSRTIWVSGLDGTWGRTEDGGATWTVGQIAGAEELQLRDIHGVDDQRAYALSAGEGDASRIFSTLDGGESWELQWTMPDEKGFLDCFDFWSPEVGLAYGDSVAGELYLLRTTDGGSWTRIPGETLPAPLGTEGGFAASGTCVRTAGDSAAWIATGAGDAPRVLRTADRGASWDESTMPTVAGSAAGLMSVVVGSDGFGGAFGGDLEQPDAATDNVAWTDDGGATWSLGRPPGFPGAIYGADLRETSEGRAVVVAGPSGVDVTLDPGASEEAVWSALSRDEYWAVAFVADRSVLAVGPEGRMTRFDF